MKDKIQLNDYHKRRNAIMVKAVKLQPPRSREEALKQQRQIAENSQRHREKQRSAGNP
jgi:hypothetical protein